MGRSLPNFDGRAGIAIPSATAAELEYDKESTALLAALEEVFVSARGNEDRARALETMQVMKASSLRAVYWRTRRS